MNYFLELEKSSVLLSDKSRNKNATKCQEVAIYFVWGQDWARFSNVITNTEMKHALKVNYSLKFSSSSTH